MKTVILIGVLLLVFSSLIIIKDWGSDVGKVELISEDDYHLKVLENFGDVEFERGSLTSGERVVEYKGNLEEYINGK